MELVGNDLSNVIKVEASMVTTILDGGAGADTLIGGSGSDTYVVDDIGDVIVEAGDFGPAFRDTVRTNLASYTLVDSVENLVFTGSGSFHGTGNASSNEIVGAAGNDTLDGGVGNGDFGDNLIGGAGDDFYRLTAIGFNRITEKQAEGTDTVEYVGPSGGYSVVMDANVEHARFVGPGSIAITGNDLGNAITTGGGDDFIDGGLGADTMDGGSGNDTYMVDDAGDAVIEDANDGNDTVVSTLQFYQLGANVENLTLRQTA